MALVGDELDSAELLAVRHLERLDPLVSGEVELDNQFALEDYELARGFVLTCQAFPVSDAVTLDFDQET